MGKRPAGTSEHRDGDVTDRHDSTPRPTGSTGEVAGGRAPRPEAGSASDLTDADVGALAGLEAGMLLVFAADGALLWANDAARSGIGAPGSSGGETERAVPAVALDDLDVPGADEPVGPGVGVAEDESLARRLGALASGTGTGWHLGKVRRLDGTIARWSWSAWRTGDGSAAVWAEDATAWWQEWSVQQARAVALEMAVERSDSAISVKDAAGRLVLANRRYLDLIGSTAGGPGEGGLSSLEREVLVGGASIGVDEVVGDPGGERTFHTVRFPLRDDGGNVVHVATLATDVTERAVVVRALAERERLYDALVRASPDVVALVDAAGNVTEMSDASFSVLGFDRPVTMPELWARVEVEDRDHLERWLRRVVVGDELAPCRYRSRHLDATTLVFEAAGRPVVGDDGGPAGAVVVIRDITATVGAEVELTRAAALAEEASRAKDELLSRMSTEMRLPIDDVLALVELLRTQELGEDQREALEHIARAGRHLRDLIDEVLEVARTETRDLELVLEALPVVAIVDDAASLARPLADQRNVRLIVSRRRADGDGDGDGEAQADLWVLADRQRLLQVLLNLLSNAVKYNHPGGTVRVSVSATADQVRVAVVDTGVGIAPEHLGRLFEPFDRLGAEHSGIEGTGVGLTLTRNLVERMGGSIEVASAVGTGSVFVVRLRRASTPAPAGDQARIASPGAAPLRILHVEDDAASGELVRQLLARRGGVELVQVGDGESALSTARAKRPDLVLLDLGLPDVTGDTVLAQLRADPVTAGIPVVVVSADATDAQRQRLAAAGAAAYLTKPLAVGEVLAVVDAVVTAAESD